MNKQLTVGMLAHVDAGKTTLTEALLFNTGTIRKLGRVDHRDTFLDTDPIERERGITVYSKQAVMTIGDKDYTLLDTPGHADLSPEMERTLWVLDYGILLISAHEGVTSRVKLLWKLLSHYNIPAFIYVNKMDMPGADKEALLEEIHKELGRDCIDFNRAFDDSGFQEDAALAEEKYLNKLLEEGGLSKQDVTNMISRRKVFPVYFGAALKNEGVEDLKRGMEEYMVPLEYSDKWGARVFKISRDAKGTRLAWIRITGGRLQVKTNLSYVKHEENVTEKIDQIRIYSGEGFTAVKEACVGTVCAITGLTRISAGEAMGEETPLETQVIEPALTYELQYSKEYSTGKVLECIKKLEEEEPKLHISFSERTGKISIHVMGRIQMEIIKRQLKERFEINIEFGSQTICYKETIAKAVIGAGHFEPLRHYAEVRLLLEPLERGSGIQFENMCPREELDIHWQRLILTHLQERTHTGVLTDSELTDIRITLLGGRSHTKHTEPGDFRQAVFRALRQGLMEASNILLEPYYDYELIIPESNIGKALFDLNQMGAQNDPPEAEKGICIIRGRGPAGELSSYQEKVTIYSSGKGRLNLSFSGYEPCPNAEQVIAEIGYEPERDAYNPSSSVFCSHGVGLIVPWDMVKSRMHTDTSFDIEGVNDENIQDADGLSAADVYRGLAKEERELSYKEREARAAAGELELQEIFKRTYGSKREAAGKPGWKNHKKQREAFDSPKVRHAAYKPEGREYLLVDGYNIIFAWPELKELAGKDINAARDRLIDVLCDYHGTRKGELILVYDAYKVAGGREAVSKVHNIYVVYTKEKETADQYIEKTVHNLGKDHRVTVATSDGLEQVIIMGDGAVRMSAPALLKDVNDTKARLRTEYLDNSGSKGRVFMADSMSDEVKAMLEDK